MAVYAAMVDRMDAAVGRVVNDLKQHQELENTLILFLSDNGACWEWDPLGFDESSSPKNILHTGEDLKKLGQPGDYMSYGSGWANAGNTPWRLYKHFSHEGGIRTPMIAHWPAGFPDKGVLRSQTGHLIDIMATLVEVAQVSYPTEIQGVKIQPMEGRSLLPALRNKAIERAEPLFFEHEGSRAVRDGNWKLVSLQGDTWELYNLETDPTEMKNLITTQAVKAQELIQKWNAWAERCHVDTTEGKSPAQPKPAPKIANVPLTIKCDVETTAKSGVILAHGGKENGYALHLAEGKVVFTVRIGGKPVAISSPETSSGKFSIQANLKKNGTMTLSINGKELAQGNAGGLIPVEPKDGLSIGKDEQTAVGDYQAPNPLQGQVRNLEILQASPLWNEPQIITKAEYTAQDEAIKALRAKLIEENPKRLEAKIYRAADGGTMPYRQFIPATASVETKLPLVLVLHGASGRGNDNLAHVVQGNASVTTGVWALPENQKAHPCFVLAPQCPPEPAFWAPIEKWIDGKHPFGDKPTPAMGMVMNLLAEFVKSHPVDPSRIYLIGPSMGGYGTWDLLARRPEQFAAAVPCCGGLADGQAAKITKVPLWIFHGGADEIVPVEYSRGAFAQLKAAGGKPRYTEFAEGPHRVSVYVLTNSAMIDWLFAQKR